MAEALQRGNEVHASNLEISKQKRLKRTILAGRKFVFKSKKKGRCEFIDKGFSTLKAQMKKTMMMMMN